MIVRRLCLRQGRGALALAASSSAAATAPPPPRCARAQSTTTTSTTVRTPEAVTTAVADAPNPPSADAARDVARAAPEDGSGGVVRHGGTTYVTRRIGPNIGDISKTYRSQQRLDNIFDSMGSIPEKRYDPLDVLLDPPQPEDVTLEMLMAAQTHMGHHRSLWNPHNSRYIYGTRQGIHIISLEQTAAHLRRAARVIEEVAFRGGLILFVGNRKGHMPIVAKAAELAGGCQLFTKWTPGSITNRDLILGRQGLKVVDEHDQVVGGFEAHLNQMRPLVPDLVVCLNPIENFTMLYECGLKSIPTIGVIDTNANPSWVTYTIPANDDSLRSLAVIAGVLGRAGEKGQKRRMEAARQGNATWQMDRATLSFLSTASKRRRDEKAASALGGAAAATRAHDLEIDQEAALLGLEEAHDEVSEDDMLEMLASAQEQAISSLGQDGEDEAGVRRRKKPAPYQSQPAGTQQQAAAGEEEDYESDAEEAEAVYKPTQAEIEAFWADKKFFDDDVLDEVEEAVEAPRRAPGGGQGGEAPREAPREVPREAQAPTEAPAEVSVGDVEASDADAASPPPPAESAPAEPESAEPESVEPAPAEPTPAEPKSTDVGSEEPPKQ